MSCGQHGFQSREMSTRNANLRRVGLATGRGVLRRGHLKFVHIAGEAALGLDFQEAGHVGGLQLGQLGVQGERPAKRDADHAAPFAHACRLEQIVDFPAHQNCFVVQEIKSQRRTHGL